MNDPTLRRIAELVGRGLVPRAPAEACLRAWQAHASAGRPVAITDLFVRSGLLTATQAAVLSRETLTDRQPFRNYRLLRQAGEGGMAVVFEATYLPLKARVALKVLDTPFCLQESFRLRFRREAQILLALDHENIVEGREYVSEDGVDFYAMAFVDGVSILDLIDKGVHLSEPLCLNVLLQVTSALQHMHRKGIIHRDMKPANLVLDHHGNVQIIDFGLAKVMTGMRQDTAEDTTVGTPEYMSPEQARGRSDVDARSDLYGLGCTLFHMLTGELPFGTGSEAIVAHVTQPFEMTAAQRARISSPVQYVLRRMLEKAPEARYESGDALIAEVRQLCAGILTRPVDIPGEIESDAIESAPIPAAPTLRPRPGSGPFRPVGPPRPGTPGGPVRPGSNPRPGQSPPPGAPSRQGTPPPRPGTPSPRPPVTPLPRPGLRRPGDARPRRPGSR